MRRWLSRLALVGAATSLGLVALPATAGAGVTAITVDMDISCGSSGTIPIFHRVEIDVANQADGAVSLTAASLTQSGGAPVDVLPELSPNPVPVDGTSSADIAPYPYEPGPYVLVVDYAIVGGPSGSVTTTAVGPVCMEPSSTTTSSSSTSTTRPRPTPATPRFTG